jgi:hypothetical protein
MIHQKIFSQNRLEKGVLFLRAMRMFLIPFARSLYLIITDSVIIEFFHQLKKFFRLKSGSNGSSDLFSKK